MPMQTQSKDNLLKSYLNWLKPHAHQVAQTHMHLLELRQNGLRQAAAIIAQQVQSYRQMPRELFSIADLREFAEGDIVKCLGQDYAVYKGRRSPRIPNGDLLLMSRIMTIQGQPGQLAQKANIASEYDVPQDAWYINENVKGQLPISICLEIALQPCGFLSAFLGTPLRFPEVDFFFRNLDGQVLFTRPVDARGKTIQTRAVLIETIFSGTTIIQHFSFELLCDGLVFFKGRSSFGYFPTQSMENQIGLDGGKASSPWFQNNIPSATLQPVSKEGSGPPADKLRLIERVVMDQSSGIHQAGYIYANRSNSAADWYYACHFYQDPVMPGSLGIEAIVQAMTVFALSQEKSHPVVFMATGQEMTWKYRGQVLQKNKQMQVEVHFRKSHAVGGARLLSGDASLWADNIRIYEIHNLTLAIQE